MSLPATVELCEVGPRDGFQFESKQIPTAKKAEIIRDLIAAGLRRLQAVSFVHPEKVPQMADAEDVLCALGELEGVKLSGLVLNLRGLDRARRAGLQYVDISVATNERHSLDNTGMSVQRAMEEGEGMVRRALDAGMKPQIGFQTVFGYASPGDTPVERVLDGVGRFADLNVDTVSLADSTGLGNPVMIEERLSRIAEIVEPGRIVLHLHDTRGLGMANVVAALRCGVRRFDTSFGGLGGCPFIPGATGNIATEDTVYLLESMGVSTGIDIGLVSGCVRKMEVFLGRALPGRLHTLVDRPSVDG